MGLAAEVAERRDGLLQRADRCHELGAVRGRHGARLPHQPDTGASEGQRATGGRRRQRQTVAGPALGVHIVPGAVPSAAKVHLRHRRPESRSGWAVLEGRAEELGHHVPDDRFAGVRRKVPSAHQRHAGQRPDTGTVCRRRDREHHSGHRAGGITRARSDFSFFGGGGGLE